MNGWADLAAAPRKSASTGNPWTPLDTARALADLLDLVTAADAQDARWRAWLRCGVRAYLDGSAKSLDVALGLKPGRGRRLTRERDDERRRDVLRMVLLTLDSRATLSGRIARLAELLQGATPEPGERDVLTLIDAAHVKLPTSERRLFELASSALRPADRELFRLYRRLCAAQRKEQHQ